VFTLELPFSDAAVTAESVGLEPSSELTASGLILVVDDEATIQMAMKSLLEGWGFKAIVAGSCDEILPLLANCRTGRGSSSATTGLRAHEDGIRVIERLRSEYNDDEIPGMLSPATRAPDRLKEAQESGLFTGCTNRCRNSPGCARPSLIFMAHPVTHPPRHARNFAACVRLTTFSVLKDGRDVHLHGFFGDAETGADLLVGEAVAQVAQHVHLAIREL